MFSCADPSLILVYDVRSNLHSAYRLRRARRREFQDLCTTLCQQSSATSLMTHLANNSSSMAQFGDSMKMPISKL